MRTPSTILLLLALALFAVPAWAQTDSDGDGVDDSIDLCPNEDASFLDTDGDGCIDATLGARHIEFWDAADLPLTYVIHEQGAPVVDDGSDFAAIQAGFDTWTTRPGVQLSVQYDGTTTQFEADGLDGINLVTFEDPGFLSVYSSAVLAVGITTSFTAPSSFNGQPVRAGQIVDADIIFNPNREFSTDTAGTGRDLQGVTFHEAGHLFGISHSAIPEASMFPVLPEGTAARTPEIDDEVVVLKAYPAAGALANATALSGTVSNGLNGSPIGGAAVLAVRASDGVKVGSEYTLADGTYSFYGLPADDYHVFVHPLDGTGGIDGMVPEVVNEYVEDIALRLFLPDYYDAAESATEDPLDKTAVTLTAGTVVSGIDVITNIDATAPQVVEVQPADLDTEIRPDALILVEFSEPIDFDALTSADFRLFDVVSGAGVGGTLAALNEQTILVFTPQGQLAYDTQYELNLGANVKDLFGNPMGADHVTTFSTQAPPALALGSIAPSSGVAHTVVVLSGNGFGSTSADNTVLFDQLTASVLDASPTRLVVEVPTDVLPGDYDVTVTSPNGTSAPVLFTALSALPVAIGNGVGTALLGGSPVAVDVLSDGAFAYAATTSGVSAVLCDPASVDFLSSVTDVPLTGGTVDVAATPDGRRVYAVSRSGRALHVVNSDYGDDVDDPDPLFNEVLDTLPTGDEPLGIVIDGAGRYAYVPTSAGTIQIWDVQLQVLNQVEESNPTYHRQVGEIDTGDTALRGSLALDPTGDRLFAVNSVGRMYVFSTDAAHVLLADVEVGGSPRDVAVDALQGAAYVSDDGGTVAVVSLTTFSVLQNIPVGGDPRGLALPAQGTGLLYVANRERDEVGIIDLDPNVFAQGADFDGGNAPVDVAPRFDGQYVMVAAETENTLRVISTGIGPVIRAISPPAVRPGQIVTITGGPFFPMEPDQSAYVSTNTVLFGDIGVLASRATTNVVEAVVPDGFPGGTVRVRSVGPAIVGQPEDPVSNPINLPLLVDHPVFDEVRWGMTFTGSWGYSWGTGVAQFPAVSPAGDLYLQPDIDGVVHILDADGASATYLREITTTAGFLNTRVVWHPDASRLYRASGQIIDVLDMDRFSPTFADVVESIDLSSDLVGSSIGTLEMVPGAEFLTFSAAAGSTSYVLDIVEDSATRNTIVGSSVGSGVAFGAVVHPSGRTRYHITAAGQGGLIHTVTLIDFGGAPPPFTEASIALVPQSPRALAVSPDGEWLYVVGKDIVGGLDHELYVYSLTGTSGILQPELAQTVVLEVASGNSINDVDTVIRMAPTGERMYIDIIPVGGIYMDLTQGLPVEINRANLNGVDDLLGVAYTPDGQRMFTASRADTYPRAIEFGTIEFTEPLPLTPEQLTGVAGETLSTPVGIRVIDVDGQPAVRKHVQFRVESGGGRLGSGEDIQIVLTDDDGEAAVVWTLGPDPDVDPNQPANVLGVYLDSKLQHAFEAIALESPDVLPLSVVRVLPTDGTTGVSSTTAVQVVFSRAVDRATVTDATYFLRDGAGNAVPAAVGYSDADRRVSLSPFASLAFDGTYEIVTAAGLLDTSGGALANPTVASFTVQSPPALAITSVSPPAAVAGVEIVLSGQGIDPDPAATTVQFLGETAVPTAAGVNFVTVRVPLNATSGPVTVTSNNQTSQPVLFTVLVPTDVPLDDILATVTTGSTLRSTAVTPNGSRSYSVSPEDDTVVPVDLVNLASLLPVGVGNQPVAIAIHPQGDRAYVVNYLSGTVSVVAIPGDTILGTIQVGQGPLDLVIDPIGDAVYVVNSLEDSFSIIDANTANSTYNTVVANASTGKTTKSVTISPDGGVLYLGTDDGFIVFSVEPASFGVVANASTGKTTKSIAISPDGNLLLLLTTDGEVLVVDVSPSGGNQVVANASTGKTTKSVAISPDGNLLYLIQDDDSIFVTSLELPGGVSKVDEVLQPFTLEVVDIIEGLDSPSFIAFDPSGTGVAVVANANGALDIFNASDHPIVLGEVITADVLVTPRTLNLSSNGRYVTGTIELPVGFFPQQIVTSSIILYSDDPQVSVTANPDKMEITDKNLDGIQELTAKFGREDFQAIMPEGDAVPVFIQGLLTNGRTFLGEDSIRTHRPEILFPRGGEEVQVGTLVPITWRSPSDVAIDAVDVHFTPDGGETWMTVVQGVADTGFAMWMVPFVYAPDARVLVRLLHNGEEIGSGLSPDAFIVSETPVAVALQSVELTVQHGSAVLQWAARGAAELGGFHVLRGEDEDGAFTRITASPVVAGPDGFVFEDASIRGNRTYYYLLEEVREDGPGYQHGPFELVNVVRTALEQNYPNAFNPKTNIRFSVAQRGKVRLTVYNVAGRRVKVLVDDILEADNYRIEWNGRDDRGADVASGIYLYRLQTEGFVATKKMTLVR